MLSKYVNNKKCAPEYSSMKNEKNEKDFDNF